MMVALWLLMEADERRSFVGYVSVPSRGRVFGRFVARVEGA